MKINKVDNVNFGITVDSKFIKNAGNYYMNRNMGIQYSVFMKTAESLSLLGEPESQIFYKAFKKDSGYRHLLCFKNEKLNKSKAYVLVDTNKYTDVLKYFAKINDKMVQTWEQFLPTLK